MTRPKLDDLSAAQDNDLSEIQGSRWRKILTRALALLLALAFIVLAFGGVLRLLGLLVLGF